MLAIEDLALSPPDDTLERLERGLHRPDATDEERHAVVAAVARDITKRLSPASDLIERSNGYAYVRETIKAKWFELPFATRMMFRDLATAYEGNENTWLSMTMEERQSLKDAMAPEAWQRFIFDRRQTMKMARDFRPLVDADPEVAKAKSAFEVWSVAKRLFPKFEDALSRPLDRSQYVDRDLRKTPRKSTG